MPFGQHLYPLIHCNVHLQHPTVLPRAGPTSKLILREMEELRRQEAAPRVQ